MGNLEGVREGWLEFEVDVVENSGPEGFLGTQKGIIYQRPLGIPKPAHMFFYQSAASGKRRSTLTKKSYYGLESSSQHEIDIGRERKSPIRFEQVSLKKLWALFTIYTSRWVCRLLRLQPHENRRPTEPQAHRK